MSENKEEMGTPAAQGASGEPKTAPGLRLELGKCYRDADGDVYGPMEATRKPNPYRTSHPFWCPRNGVSFTAEGFYFSGAKPNEVDLVAEVTISDAAGVPEPQAKGPSPSEVTQPGEGVGLEAMRKALEAAEHELTTLHGLTATDDPHAYSEALSEGLDTNGAADCARESTWVIDTSKTRAIIRAALGKAGA